MKTTSKVPILSDEELDRHIEQLQAKLTRVNINLELATAEKRRRTQTLTEVKSEIPATSRKVAASNKIILGSQVQILNKYRGNRGKVGKVIQISGKTATVHIPQEGSFVKYLSNLKLIDDEYEE